MPSLPNYVFPSYSPHLNAYYCLFLKGSADTVYVSSFRMQSAPPSESCPIFLTLTSSQDSSCSSCLPPVSVSWPHGLCLLWRAVNSLIQDLHWKGPCWIHGEIDIEILSVNGSDGFQECGSGQSIMFLKGLVLTWLFLIWYLRHTFQFYNFCDPCK